MTTHHTYAWLGLGAMGGPMATHLVEAGHTVFGFDVSEQAKDTARANGITVVDTIAEAVREVDAVFMTLPAGPHVRSTLEGENGVWANAPTHTLIIDSSSVDLDTSRWCHDRSVELGFRFVDAPISGSATGAQDATLTFMLGGHPEAVAETRAHAQPMGKTFVELGGPTAGMAAKLCNNMMLFANIVASAEAIQLAKKLGIDPTAFWELVNVSTGHSWPQEHWYPIPGVAENSPANHGFAPTGFAAKNAVKDLSNALAAGDEVRADLPATTLAHQRLTTLIDQGLGELDSTFISSLVFPHEPLEGYHPDAEQSPVKDK